MTASLRPYAPDDIDALRNVCLKTAAAGGDATGLVSNPELPGDVYAAPYAVLEPAGVLVLESDTGGVVGYVLGALDTASFEARCVAEWWPIMREQHPLGAGDRALDGLFLELVHEPRSTDPSLLERYPSHLHINVLPEMQGSGWGRSMIESMLSLLAARGSIGLHLGVSTDNEPALKFYTRLGFELLESNPDEQRFGISLDT